MNFTNAVASYFRNFANFDGRASRSEFWYANLFNFMVSFGLGIFGEVATEGGDWSSNQSMPWVFSCQTLRLLPVASTTPESQHGGTC